MVQRINFLEKGPFALTYRNMLIIAALFSILCLMIYGSFGFRHMLLADKIKKSQTVMQELTVSKEKALAMMQATQNQQANVGAVQTLTQLFSKMPVWSSALADLSQRVPKQLWLKNIKSEGAGDQAQSKKVEVAGKSFNAGSVGKFVKGLEDSELFKNVALVSTKKEADGFAFVVNFEVEFPQSQW